MWAATTTAPPARRPDEVFVEEHSVGVGHHRPAAAPDRRPGLDDRALEVFGQRRVGTLPLELLADVAPLDVELGRRVLGVVRVLEIDRRVGSVRAHQCAEVFGIHGFWVPEQRRDKPVLRADEL